MSFNILSPTQLLERVSECGGGAGGAPPFTLVLGSGFSYGIIPTTAQVVREDLPWWKWCQRGEKDGPTLDHYRGRKEADFAVPAKEKAKEFWAKVSAAHRAGGRSAFAVDADGLPTGEGVGEAYRFALSPECGLGLHSHALVRRYFGDIIHRVGRRLNPAHLYLAALIAERPGLFGTIFTTNFDPLMQRSLQLMNAPYYVSDRPDTMEFVEDDGVVDGVHLVHAHGSIYRYLLLNSPDEIEKYAARNQKNLEQYFRKHAVLIVGYSGWDDAITRALGAVERFDHNLYWTDRAGDPERSNLTAAAKAILRKHRNAFYVPITGGDALMVELHQHLIGHSLPKVFREPILVAREQFEFCDLAGVKLSQTASRSAGNTADSDGGGTGEPSATGMAETRDLGDEVKGVRKRLDDAQDLFTGKTSTDPQAVLAAETRRRFAVGSDHYFSNRFVEALQEFEFVVPNQSYLTPLDRVQVYGYRAGCYWAANEVMRAIEDLSIVIKSPDTPADKLAWALYNRGVAYDRLGMSGQAIADYKAIIDNPDSPAQQRLSARLNRGVVYGKQRELDPAIADLTVVIDDPDAQAEHLTMARNNRGFTYELRAEPDRAIDDYTAVINDPIAPAEQREKATRRRERLLTQQVPPGPEPAASLEQPSQKKRPRNKKAVLPAEPPPPAEPPL